MKLMPGYWAVGGAATFVGLTAWAVTGSAGLGFIAWFVICAVCVGKPGSNRPLQQKLDTMGRPKTTYQHVHAHPVVSQGVPPGVWTCATCGSKEHYPNGARRCFWCGAPFEWFRP